MLYRRNRVLPAMVFSVLVGGARGACAASFAFTPLNTDGADLATPQAINSSDQVVGYTTDSNGVRVGFVWSAGQLSLVDGSGSLRAITDSGIAVGYPWLNEKNYYVSYNLSSGVLSDVTPNIGLHGKPAFAATGINAAGTVIGAAVAKSDASTGFMTIGGNSIKLLPPKQKNSLPIGLNTKGDVVIDYVGGSQDISFIYRNGKFAKIVVPGASATLASFITDKDMIGGSFTSGGTTSGFLFSNGTYTAYSPAGATSSSVTGVGPSGQVYGTFVDASGNTHGFENVSGTFYQIDVPNSTYTNILAVGTSGSLIGFYGTSQGGQYGYIGTCPKKDVCTQ